MKNIKFIKEPGYIYDLFFLFVLYFNKEYCLANYINYNKSSEDIKYYNDILLDFLPIPDELLPFFYLKENNISFMFQYYYNPYKETFLNSYNLSFIQEKLSNNEKIINNLLYYYFDEVNEENVGKYRGSVYEINKLIRNSKYNGELKSSLYSFFIDPVPVIQKLLYELTAKNFLLSQKYEKAFQKVVDYQNKFDFDSYSLKLKHLKNYKINLDSFNDIYISLCLLQKNITNIYFCNNETFEVLGIDSDSYLDYLIEKNDLPTLDAFGNIMSEKNRIKILDLILRKGEITIRDIEQELGFTGTNAYYHINLMIKANMVYSRNQGRIVLYIINGGYFDSISEILNKYKKTNLKGNLFYENMEPTN